MRPATIRPTIRLTLALTTAIGLVLPCTRNAVAQDAAGPPGRVGQIALVRGAVSFAGAGNGAGNAPASGTSSDSQWTQAALNYPITSGDALYTQPGAEAAVAIDWSRITLNQSSELQITRIGAHNVDAALSQGEAYLDVRYLRPGDAYVITTPRGTVNITRNGAYDIVAGDGTAPTMVTVSRGAAQLQGQSVSLNIGPGETATLQGADPVTASLGGEQRDPFMVRMRQVRYAAPPTYVPPIINQMTGGYQLAHYGSWSQSPQYGAVWYPRVASSWVPYRDGHWAYVAPWGWTWVDNDPWGFAPFHYGRWVQYGGRWGWAPAPVAYAAPAYYQPVYAPALVSFFNVGSGVAIGVGITAGAFAAGSIGWVPLAPREPYYPWYHAPQQYVRNINYYNVRNVNRYADIHNTTIINNYGPARLINRGGATIIPAVAMRRGDPVGRFGRPAPQQILAAARPVPPAGFRGPPHPAPGGAPARPGFAARPNLPGPGPGPLPAPGFGRLPGAPGRLIHPIAALAPRPAPFAASRGLPVGHPGPIRSAALRPQIHVLPHAGVHPAAPQNPAPAGRPAPAHPVTTAIGRPMTQAGLLHPAVPRAPAAPARPQFHPLPRTMPAPPAQRPSQFHPPINRAPINHAPVQQFRPAQQHPVQPVQRVPQTHPVNRAPAYHPPVQQFHPPINRAPINHAPVQQFHPAPQQFHPPVQQFHPAINHAPINRAPVQQFHPAPPQFHPPVQQAHPAPQRPAPHPAPGPDKPPHP